MNNQQFTPGYYPFRFEEDEEAQTNFEEDYGETIKGVEAPNIKLVEAPKTGKLRFEAKE